MRVPNRTHAHICTRPHLAEVRDKLLELAVPRHARLQEREDLHDFSAIFTGHRAARSNRPAKQMPRAKQI